jgi:hypothetical protein
MRRLASVLPREILACQRTLEQKISEGGPKPQRIDPHLLGLAIRELLQERELIRHHTHTATRSLKWFSYLGTPEAEILQKLVEIAPLYAQVTQTNFKNLIGDALEIIVYKSLLRLHAQSPRYTPLGSFDLEGPRSNRGRHIKTDPQRNIVGNVTTKVPDFILTGFDIGPIWIECKNYREWLYPEHKEITELIPTATLECITKFAPAKWRFCRGQ